MSTRLSRLQRREVEDLSDKIASAIDNITFLATCEYAFLDMDVKALWVELGGRVCECGQLAVHGSTMCGTCAAKML